MVCLRKVSAWWHPSPLKVETGMEFTSCPRMLHSQPNSSTETGTCDVLILSPICYPLGHIISTMMCTNLLKHNDEKMESVLFGTRQQLEIAGKISIKIGNDNIMSTNSAKNLRMIMNNHPKGTLHINKLVSSTFVSIQNT